MCRCEALAASICNSWGLMYTSSKGDWDWMPPASFIPCTVQSTCFSYWAYFIWSMLLQASSWFQFPVKLWVEISKISYCPSAEVGIKNITDIHLLPLLPFLNFPPLLPVLLMINVTHLMGWLRSLSLSSFSPYLSRLHCLACQFTVKNGHRNAKRCLNRQSECQIYSTLPWLHSSNFTTSVINRIIITLPTWQFLPWTTGLLEWGIQECQVAAVVLN